MKSSAIIMLAYLVFLMKCKIKHVYYFLLKRVIFSKEWLNDLALKILKIRYQ